MSADSQQFDPGLTLRELLVRARSQLDSDPFLVRSIDKALSLDTLPFKVDEIDGYVSFQLDVFALLDQDPDLDDDDA